MAPKRKADGSSSSSAKHARGADELLVVSIDFGTRGTGYAYAFVIAPIRWCPSSQVASTTTRRR